MMDRQRGRMLRIGAALAVACGLAALAGCGGSPDLGGYQQNSSFSSGLSGGYGGYGSGGYGGSGGTQPGSAMRGQGTYAMVETTFELPDVHGNPFDFAENDVQVTLAGPDGRTTRVPAFYDGGSTWRARFTPDTAGRFTVSDITLNRTRVDAQKVTPHEFTVSGSPQPGFVQRDPRSRARFSYTNGTTYYPIGVDAGAADPAQAFQAIASAGGNWSRVEMTRAAGTDLEQPAGKTAKLGAIDLDAAKKWDAIVTAADKVNVDFEMAFEQYLPFSSRGNGQWAQNPLNKANGGFLSSPDEFFSDPRAIALTRAMIRYAIARWGYSTAVMAWELFDGVDRTDAVYHKHADEVAAWHRGMADFIHQQDPYHHLVTTDAGPQLADVWSLMDFYQARVGGPDAIAQVAGLETRSFDRPVVLCLNDQAGEPSGAAASAREALWSGLAGDLSGACLMAAGGAKAAVSLTSVAEFLRRSGVASRRGLTRTDGTLETSDRAALTFRPGGGPVPPKQTEWLISPSGAIQGLAAMPSVLTGTTEPHGFRAAKFKVSFAQAGSFAVSVSRVSKEGGTLVLSVDGASAASKAFGAGAADADVNATVEAKVPAGPHTVRVENTGPGWIGIDRFRLAQYAPTLAAIGSADKTFAVQWIYRRDPSAEGAAITGKLLLPGLQAGEYRATWWDTESGKSISEETAKATKAGTLSLTTPPVARDVALYVEKVAAPGEKERTAGRGHGGARGGRGEANGRPPAASAPGAGQQ